MSEALLPGMPRDEAAFWRRVAKSAACWEYVGSRSTQGYGTCRVVGGYDYAHRIAYRYEHGQIPEGMVIDHLCRNRACVRPLHLEAVTQQINTQRGARSMAFTGKCLKGLHPIDSNDDLVETSRGPTCRSCLVNSRASHYSDVRDAAQKLGIPITKFIRQYGRSARKAREILNG